MRTITLKKCDAKLVFNRSMRMNQILKIRYKILPSYEYATVLKNLKNVSDYTLFKGKVYTLSLDKRNKPAIYLDNKIVVSDEDVFDLLDFIHTTTGHGGRMKMLDRLDKLEYDIGTTFVLNYLRTCTYCQNHYMLMEKRSDRVDKTRTPISKKYNIYKKPENAMTILMKAGTSEKRPSLILRKYFREEQKRKEAKEREAIEKEKNIVNDVDGDNSFNQVEYAFMRKQFMDYWNEREAETKESCSSCPSSSTEKVQLMNLKLRLDDYKTQK